MFFVFSLASSAVYVFNDILDLKEDKLNPQKRLRPLASEKITVKQAALTSALLAGTSLLPLFFLGWEAAAVLLGYFTLNLAYAKFLRNIILIDVLCVAAFYYLRVLAGGITGGVALSHWLILCTVLLALFLILNKRRYDLKWLAHRPVPAKYSASLLNTMIAVAAVSVIAAYTFYAVDPETVERIGTNHLIYTVPFVCYGVLRYLRLAKHPSFDGDPSSVLMKDFQMQLILTLWVITSMAMVYPGLIGEPS